MALNSVWLKQFYKYVHETENNEKKLNQTDTVGKCSCVTKTSKIKAVLRMSLSRLLWVSLYLHPKWQKDEMIFFFNFFFYKFQKALLQNNIINMWLAVFTWQGADPEKLRTLHDGQR